MRKVNDTVKNYIYISTYIVILFFAILNIKSIIGFLKSTIGILTPFIIGIVIAFVLNILVKLFENRVFKFFDNKKYKSVRKLKRPLAIIASLVLIVTAITLLILFVVPQLIDSLKKLMEAMEGLPAYFKEIEELIKPIISSTDVLKPIWDTFMKVWQDVLQVVVQIFTVSLNGIVSTTVTATTIVVKIVIGFVFAIYMLSNKEILILQIKKTLYAYLKKDKVDYIISVGKLTNNTFSRFIAGQLIEAIILGTLCFIGMVIMRMPYPLLIGVIIGATNMLPVIGPFIGCIPSAFIILMVDPTKAFWFIIFIIVLQQVESHLIYPKVVGTSIGLSAIWVLLAITIGGSVGGAVGMLLGVPSMAVIYRLASININSRLYKKGLVLENSNFIKQDEISEDGM